MANIHESASALTHMNTVPTTLLFGAATLFVVGMVVIKYGPPFLVNSFKELFAKIISDGISDDKNILNSTISKIVKDETDKNSKEVKEFKDSVESKFKQLEDKLKNQENIFNSKIDNLSQSINLVSNELKLQSMQNNNIIKNNQKIDDKVDKLDEKLDGFVKDTSSNLGKILGKLDK